MKVFLTFLLFALTVRSFSNWSDTTIHADLNFDRIEEAIKCSYHEDSMEFILMINDEKITGVFYDTYDYSIEIIDINRNDNLKEVMVKGYGASDQNDMYFYQFSGGKIIPCGHLPSNFGVEATGNGTLTEYGWMGFWSIKLKYDFDTKKKALTPVEEEFYDVKQECEVKNPFRLLKERDDNSDVSVNLSPKTKLMIVKADISPKCNYSNGTVDDFTCDWYLIRTLDGKEGWCRLKDFQENVDGLIWAG